MYTMSNKDKESIDSATYAELLKKWRFAPSGDPMFQGDTGEYFSLVMHRKRICVDFIQISKDIGWAQND